MSRIRSIKPDFFLDDEIASLGAITRLLFIGLWTQADRAGRLKDKPTRIKAAVLPYDDVDVDAMLDSLQEAGFITRYEVEGHRYIQVLNFDKHQRFNNENPSVIPAICDDYASDSLVVIHGREGKGEEGKRSGKEGEKLSTPDESQTQRPALTHLPDCFSAETVSNPRYSGGKQITLAQMIHEAAQARWGVFSLRDLKVFATSVHEGCVPDCQCSIEQRRHCFDVILKTIEDKRMEGPFIAKMRLFAKIVSRVESGGDRRCVD